MKYVLLLQAAATLFMTGVIWFVQVVHYPLMARVGAAGFPDYEAAHARLTGYVVVGPWSSNSRVHYFFCFDHPPQFPDRSPSPAPRSSS
jgi:hypothetical protein